MEVSDTTEKIIENTWGSNKDAMKVILAIYSIPVTFVYGLYKWYKGELDDIV